jgi:hypothetical protein
MEHGSANSPSVTTGMVCDGTAIVFVLLLFLTNLPPQWERLPCDCAAYQAIAEAAPGLPPGQDMRYHWAQRYPLPWFLGLAAKGTGLSVNAWFAIAAYALTAGVTLLFVGLARRLLRSGPLILLATALLVFNPYMFRYYLTVPPMLTDLFFTLGLAVLLHGLLKPSVLCALLGALVMGSARQTALLCVPAIVLFLGAGERAGGWSWQRRLGLAAATLPAIVFLYSFTGWVAAAFAGESYNLTHVTGIFSWFTEHYSTAKLADFVLRFAIMLVMPAALFVPLLYVQRRRLYPLCRSAVDLRHGRLAEPLLLLLFAGAILAQPVLAGPGWAIDSVQRYCGMALIPLLLGLLVLVEESGGAEHLERPGLLSLLVLGLGFSSLHHSFTFLGPADDRKARFVALYFLLAALLFAVQALHLRRRTAAPTDHATPTESDIPA